jgi:hypothetical protein
MKRLVSILSAVGVIMTLTACNDGDKATIASSWGDSRTKAVSETAASGDLAIYMLETLSREEGNLYRQGDSFFIHVVNGDDEFKMIVIDNVAYNIYDESETCYFHPIDEEELEDLLYNFLIDIEKVSYLDSGRAEFQGKEQYFEDFSDNMTEGRVHRYYFELYSLIGIALFEDGELAEEFAVLISSDVPEGVFELPEDYEMVDVSMFNF